MQPIEYVLARVDEEYNPPSSPPTGKELQSLRRQAISVAEANGLLYEYLHRSEVDGSEIASERTVELEKTEQRLQRTIEAIDAVADEHKVDYVLIKDCNTVPHLPRDVDVFVPEEQVETFVAGMIDMGFNLESANEIETAVDAEQFLPVDVYSRIVYFGHEFLTPEFIATNTQRRKIFGVEYEGLSNEVEYVLHLVHSLFGHRRITLLDFLHLERIERGGVNREVYRAHAQDQDWAACLCEIEDRIETMRTDIYERGQIYDFPYLFALSFTLDAINAIDRDGNASLLSVIPSLLLDGVKLRIENTRIETLLKRWDPVRKSLMKVGYLSRKARGDKYS